MNRRIALAVLLVVFNAGLSGATDNTTSSPTMPYEKVLIGVNRVQEHSAPSAQGMSPMILSRFFYFIEKGDVLPNDKPFNLFHVADATSAFGEDLRWTCAVIQRQDLLEDTRSSSWFSCFSGFQKRFENFLGFSYSGKYELGLVAGPQGEELVYAFADQGANGREVTHRLYLLKEDALVTVWEMKENYQQAGHLGVRLPRNRTTISFAAITSPKPSIEVTLESTEHDRTARVFTWEEHQGVFIETRR